MEPVIQFTCRDRNRLGIQGDMLGASVFGINTDPVPQRRPPDLGRPPAVQAGLRPGFDQRDPHGAHDAE